MCYIGIDPSLTNTAVVALDDDAKLIKSISITPEIPTKPWRGRVAAIQYISTHFNRFLWDGDVGNWAMDAIVLEGYSYASRYQSHQLGELGYIFRAFMASNLSDYSYVVPPKRLAKFITGNGNSNKKQVASFIHDLYDLKFDNLHLSDACAAALFGLALSGISDQFTEDQLKLVKEYG